MVAGTTGGVSGSGGMIDPASGFVVLTAVLRMLVVLAVAFCRVVRLAGAMAFVVLTGAVRLLKGVLRVFKSAATL